MLRQLEQTREPCKQHAAFLALLGGTWLEEGDPAQALLWLERALLLEPDLLGAQVDHALALQALGEDTARQQLLRQWATRTDIPPLAFERLSRGIGAVDVVALNATPQKRWVSNGELTLMVGHESNLDQSPKLEEFVITPPGGDVSIPVDQRPRSGAAALGEASWQLAYGLRPGVVVQAGVQGSGRQSPDEPGTNWRALRLASGLSYRLDNWRVLLQGSQAWSRGPLSNPYRLGRLSFALEHDGPDCGHRLGAEAERRFEGNASLTPGRVAGVHWVGQCSLGAARGWKLAVAVRHAVDKPVQDNRPGGEQRQWGLGLRLFGQLTPEWTLDLGLRAQDSRDAKGYSPLLNNDARRRMQSGQLSVELARRLPWAAWGGTEWLVQAFVGGVDSNLAIFSYRSNGLMTGLRLRH